MTLTIDAAFICTWHPRYEETEDDESEYQRLVKQVASELLSTGTIAKETFLAIWAWKGAMRVIRFVDLAQFEQVYQPALRRASLISSEQKLPELIGAGRKLPGVAGPTGSTLIHFMHPKMMPIIDVRTVEVLLEAGVLKCSSRELDNYEDFRRAIEAIKIGCKTYNLREIDRALFAYHKLYLERKSCTRHRAKF